MSTPPKEILLTRKRGDTDYEMCGWCKHRGCGTYQYDCMLENGKCDLLPNYHRNNGNYNWDTKCLVKNMSVADLKYIIKMKNCEIKEDENRIERRKKQIGVLEELVKTAKNTPIDSNNRYADHFNIGDKIVVWENNKWYLHTVGHGYRHHDGCVSWETGAGCGVCWPGVMLKSEYDYFVKHPDEWLIWRDNVCSKKYNGSTTELPNVLEEIK
jgi:hypothetical protein